MKKTLFYLFNMVLPLFAGLFVYLAIKPDSYISSIIYGLFQSSDFISLPYNKFIYCYFGDLCWSHSLSSALSWILGSDRKSLIMVVLLNAILSTLIEILQKVGAVNGTFDFLDVIIQIIGSLIAALIIFYFFKERDNGKNN